MPMFNTKKLITITMLNFSNALNIVKMGGKVRREGWNGAGMYIELQTPTETSKMGRPYIFMYPVDGKLVPWVASQTDLLAEDWVQVVD